MLSLLPCEPWPIIPHRLALHISGSSQVGDFFAVAAAGERESELTLIIPDFKNRAGLIMYEFTITFNKEVGLFWKRKITLSSVLFLLNRYLPLIVNMIYAPWPLSLSPKTQEVGDVSHSVMY